MSEKPTKSKQEPKVEEPDSAEDVAFDKDKKRTPEQWMARLGRYAKSRRIGKLARHKIPHWQHSCADAMAGWSQHAHDANEPLRLTQEDYEGALKASEGKAPYKPPAGAISPHCKIEHDAKPGAEE